MARKFPLLHVGLLDTQERGVFLSVWKSAGISKTVKNPGSGQIPSLNPFVYG